MGEPIHADKRYAELPGEDCEWSEDFQSDWGLLQDIQYHTSHFTNFSGVGESIWPEEGGTASQWGILGHCKPKETEWSKARIGIS